MAASKGKSEGERSDEPGAEGRDPPDTPPPPDAMACTPILRPGLTAEAPELVGGGAVAAVVARSASVGANHKMLCACDGTVIWDAEALMPGGTGRAKPVAKQDPGA